MFKKINFLKMFCFSVFLFGIFGMSSYAFDETDGSKSNDASSQVSDQKISRGRVFGNNILSMETFEYFPEKEVLGKNEEKLYKKTVKVTKEFGTRKKDNNFKTVAKYEFQVVFTYDKKSFVKVEDAEKDIDVYKSNSKWSIMDVKEIFSDDKICLVSGRCSLYKEDALGFHTYMADGHADVFCSIMGQVGINADLH